MIKFRYKMDRQLSSMLRSTIIEYSNDYLLGYIEESAATPYSLPHVALYLVCEFEDDADLKSTSYHNPLAIVAKNEREAIQMFYEITEKENGIILFEIAHKCDEITVEPV